MMKLKVIDIKGKETGRDVNLDESIFGLDVNEHVIYLSVKQYLSNLRQGTHKSKEKSEISASTRKIKKQKGTGTARAGSLKSPIFRGGGRVFGPRVRDYNFKLNKKVKRLAVNSTFSKKAKENNISILEDFDFSSPRTKDFIDVLSNLKLNNKKSLFIMSNEDKNVYLSSRNIKGVNVIDPNDVNAYAILNSDKLIITEKALDRIQNNSN